MGDVIYHLKAYAAEQQSTIANFPIAIKEMPPGQQAERLWHMHDSMELVLVTAGSGVHFLNGESAFIRTGDVLVVYPGLQHGYANCESLGLVNILYDNSKLPIPVLDGMSISLFRRILPENPAEAAKEQQVSARPLMHFSDEAAMSKTLAAVRELDEELTTLRPGNMLASTVKFLDVILTILRHAKSSASDLPAASSSVFLFGKIIQYLNQNYTRKISLGTLVKLSWLTPRVFQSRFKEQTGMSVTEYVARKRLAHAQELLRQASDRNILEVALDSGYCSASDFSSKFRQRTGMTPREYRRKISQDRNAEPAEGAQGSPQTEGN